MRVSLTPNDRRQTRNFNFLIDEQSFQELGVIAAEMGTTKGRLAKRILWNFIEAYKKEAHSDSDGRNGPADSK